MALFPKSQFLSKSMKLMNLLYPRYSDTDMNTEFFKDKKWKGKK